jgi:hypothetical protein
MCGRFHVPAGLLDCGSGSHSNIHMNRDAPYGHHALVYTGGNAAKTAGGFSRPTVKAQQPRLLKKMRLHFFPSRVARDMAPVWRAVWDTRKGVPVP